MKLNIFISLTNKSLDDEPHFLQSFQTYKDVYYIYDFYLNYIQVDHILNCNSDESNDKNVVDQDFYDGFGLKITN